MSPVIFVLPLVPLAIATACDLRRREIPDWIPASILAWALVAKATGHSPFDWVTLAAGAALGCVIAAALFALAGFGGGDAKLVAALGVLLGAKGLLLLLYYVALAGGALALIAVIRERRDMAYGPAIALGYAALLAVTRGVL